MDLAPKFEEIQRFNKWWHYFISFFPFVLIAIIFYFEWSGIIKQKPNENPETFNWIMIVTLGSTLLFSIWFVCIKLNTVINSDGIEVKFHFIPFCHRSINWEDIQSVQLIKYSPISDYGGWGVRYSHVGKGWCYNVAGEYGIYITYKNGKTFLIGTQQKEEAENIINYYRQKVK